MYEPREDSYLLSEELKKYLIKLKNRKINALDIGTGSGIQAETISEFINKKNITCSDINKEAIEIARKKGFKAVKSDLFSNIKRKFDLIVFNPPYLPKDRHDKKKDTTGGKKGDETILRFLKQSKKHLNQNGKIFLLLSSLTPRANINKELKKHNFKIKKTGRFFASKKQEIFKMKKLSEKKLFFEKLEVWMIN
ncbi:MAG: methyltransferase [Nanoarchaeota archaeon]|nr:methyltransferase [Nanoarchaeota archaeon]